MAGEGVGGRGERGNVAESAERGEGQEQGREREEKGWGEGEDKGVGTWEEEMS